MNVFVAVAWAVLAYVPPPIPCNSGERTLTPTFIAFTGPACRVPQNPYIQWWENNGKTAGQAFNAEPQKVIERTRIGVYYPPAVWLTAENASECVKGERMALTPGGTCFGYFDLPCAAALYRLEVTPGLRVEVRRSLRRRGQKKERCEHSHGFNPNATFTNGEVLTVTLFSAAGKSVCYKTIDLDTLGNSTFRDTYVVAEGKWVGEEPPGRRRPVARNRGVYAAAVEADAGVPDEIVVKLVPVQATP